MSPAEALKVQVPTWVAGLAAALGWGVSTGVYSATSSGEVAEVRQQIEAVREDIRSSVDDLRDRIGTYNADRFTRSDASSLRESLVAVDQAMADRVIELTRQTASIEARVESLEAKNR